MGKKKALTLEWGELPQMHPHAAGLDIGAREIVACVPKAQTDKPIQVFGTYTPDLRVLAQWLEDHGIDTVAMEATGVYWIPVYDVLVEHGFEVYLVNARHLKNVPGRKSDWSDAQWIQMLHSCGLLRASFLPDETWRKLRTYWRQRQSLIEHRAPHIQHMQKAMQQMNVQLAQVLTDVTGVTGLQIIRAIVAGERSPAKLASFRDRRCARTEEEITKALTGNYREEHIFVLQQALELYDFYTAQIEACDAEMQRQYDGMPDPPRADGDSLPPLEPRRNKRSHSKNAPAFDVRTHLYRFTGVDLVAITGLEESTVQTIIVETGIDMSPWRTVKHFSSWLGLAPHNDVSGGRVLRSRTLKQRNRAGQAFRLAAQSVIRSKTAFGAFFRRLRAHIGVEQAIVATAHKIARTFYALLKKGVPYQEMGADEYERRHQDRVIARVRRTARSMGYELVPLEQLAA